MTAILVQFPDESVKLDDVEERRVLTALEVIYEGGSLHGKTADFPTRDVERLVVGVHRRNWHFFETYERTICVDIRSRRTIFRYAGERSFAMPANDLSLCPASLLNSTTAVGGRGCSGSFASAN
jgi:hypothetical protein